MNLRRTFLAVATAVSLAAVGMYPVVSTDWFSQTFEGLADGTAFTEKTGQGKSGGDWESIPAGAATVATINERKGIRVDTAFCTNAIRFVASGESAQTVRRMDFAVSCEPMPWLPAVFPGDKAALSFVSNDNGMMTFIGYTDAGWTKLSCQGLVQRKAEWIDCRAEFDYGSAAAYVTYYACCGGRDYQPLADADGKTRFLAAGTGKVGSVAFYGAGAVGDFRGFGISKDTTRIYTWTGPTDGAWDNPANWQDYLGANKVPGDGDLAQVPANKRIVFGKYTIAVWGDEGAFSIVSNTCLRISSGTVQIHCDDGDYTSLGTVCAEAGATLQAVGRYYDVQMAAGSTLDLTAALGLEIVGAPFFLDGVNLSLDVSEMTEERVVVSAPYGSGGALASLSISGGSSANWTVAWHGRLDGPMALWLARPQATGAIAVWKDGTWGNLTDQANWSRVPGAGIAARIGNGRASMSGNLRLDFAFARWFDIGYAGEGEVSVHKGDFTIGGDSAGAAVVVGSEGGAGLLDVVGGLVRPYDYLWNYALTLGSGTNATGAVKVRGGTLDVAGGSVSVGAESAASMLVDSGLVSVGDSLGVGYAGTLDVSGGVLAVSNSLYIGRSVRGEAYDVKMTVSDGAVSNLTSGAIWVGSYGGVGSKAVLSLTGGEVYATNSFVCGGYRSAQVDVAGGTLVAPEICMGSNFVDSADIATFNLVSGRVETAGFSAGANGVREVVLAGGDLVATAANDDFFAGIELVELAGETVFSNARDVVIRSALMGPGGLVKAGYGTNTIAGYVAWAGETVVSEGVLDMAGGMLMGELSVAPGASVVRAKYDEADVLLPLLSAEDWRSGTALTTRPFVSLEFALVADGQSSAVATDDEGVTQGAISSVVDASAGEGVFLGWTVLGWMELGFWDGTAVKAGESYNLRMVFDFREGKPYVIYYAKRDSEWERLVSADGISAFPVAGEKRGIMTFQGVGDDYVGKQLYLAAGMAFYWVGPDDGEWNDGRNWSDRPGGEPGRDSAYPKAGGLAFVEKPARIHIATAANTALLMVNDDVRLAGEKALSVSSAISGVGRLTLEGATLQAVAGVVSVNVPVIAAEGSSNRFLSTPATCTFDLNGPLRGTGELVLSALNRRPMGGTVLAGDNSAFCGVVKVYPYWLNARDHQQLDMPSIASPQASSASAQWEINVEHDYPNVMKPGVDFFGTADATYRFGSLKANFYYSADFNAYWAKDGVTLEVGALDMDGYALGRCAAKGGTIDWVAPTATFWNGVESLAVLRISGGGTLVVTATNALPSSAITFADKGGELFYDENTDISGLITNSTAPVVFNGGDGWCEWAGAPGPSNVGGVVKRGAGTLVWYAVPSNRIDVTVEQGVLIVPFGTRLGRVSVSRGASIVVDCSEAVEDALVFSADACDTPWLRAPELQFQDVPEGYEITRTYGKDNAVVASNGGNEFVWTGAAGDLLWSTPGNWRVGMSVPARPPKEFDRVVYEGSSTTCLDAPVAAMTFDGSGDVAFTGSFALDVLLRFTLDGILDFQPNPMTSDASSVDYYGAVTNMPGIISVAEFSARTVRGEGFVSTGDKDIVVSATGDVTNRFVGMLQAANFVKRGDGTFEFVGDGAFSGRLAVEQGTLRLGSYRDIDGIRMDFDASDEDSLELDGNGAVSRWTSQVGTNAFDYAAGQLAVPTKACFGGRTAVMLRPSGGDAYSRYDLTPANMPGDVSKSLFLVYCPAGSDGGYGYAQSGSEGADRCLYRDVSSENSPWICRKEGFSTVGIFTGNSYGSAAIFGGVPALTFWSDTALQDDPGIVESLGTAGKNTGFRGAVGEVVAFTRTLTHVERDVTSRLLMSKWGISGGGEFSPVHADTPVTMCAGATLDLGGQTFDVASFTGAGIVTNGILRTADNLVTQSGGDLNVPAVEGMTYVASNAGDKLIIRDAPGVKVRIVLKKGWFSAGNPGRRVIFCESKNIEWDIWNDRVRPIDEGDGWWSIAGGGFAIRLR